MTKAVLLYSFLFLYIVCLWIVNLVVAEFVCAMPEYYLFIFQKKKFIEKKNPPSLKKGSEAAFIRIIIIHLDLNTS